MRGFSTNTVTSFDSSLYAIFLELYVEFQLDRRRVSFSKRPTFTKIQYGKDRPPQSIQIASVDETSNRRSLRYWNKKATEWYLY